MQDAVRFAHAAAAIAVTRPAHSPQCHGALRLTHSCSNRVKRLATMKDVARLAGVSTSTVSHVINNNRFVSEQVRDRVEQAIRELNYAPWRAA